MALWLDDVHEKLILAAGFIDVDVSAGQYRHAVLRLEFHIAKRALEAHALELGLAVLEREIAMAARSHAAAGDFAGHPDVVEFDSEQVPNARIQFADGVGSADGLPGKSELFH